MLNSSLQGLAVTTRNDCLQLEKSELDLILSQLQAFCSHPDQPVSVYSLSKLQRHRVFNFHKLKVCLKTFLFIHAVSHKRFEALQRYLDTLGLYPHVQCNVKHLPHNNRPQEDMFLALGFIDNFFEIHDFSLLGRMPNHQDSNVVILPSYLSKSYVYQVC